MSLPGEGALIVNIVCAVKALGLAKSWIERVASHPHFMLLSSESLLLMDSVWSLLFYR